MKKIILLCLLSSPAWAALTPKAVEESALRHHPTVKAALARMLAGVEGARGAKGAFDAKLVGDHYRVASGFWSRTFSDLMLEKPLPVANSKVYAGYSYGFNGQFPPQFSTWSTNSGGTPRVGLATSLWRHRSLDSNRAGLKHAQLDARMAQAESALAQWDIGRLAQVAYWEWVTAKRVTEVYANLLKNAEVRSEFLTSRAQRGDVPRLLVRENEQYIASRKAGLFASQERLIRAEYALSLFWRTEDGQPQLPAQNSEFEDYPEKLSDILKSETLKSDVESIARLRPDLKNLSLNFQKSQLDRELSEHDLKPKVDVWGDYTRNIGNEDPANPPHIWSFGVKLEIPIERNLGKGNIAAAKAREAAAQREWQLGVESYRNEINAARRGLELQEQQVEQSFVELTRARELVEAENYKLKTGGGSLFLVNLREEAQASAEASWHEARFGFMANWLGYAALVKTETEEAP